jgi:acylphosphatase
MTAERHTGDQKTRRYLFFGRVQGVGFRYTTAELAQFCSVRGYVRNRSDGSVELVAQGSENQIDRLLDQLGKHFAGNIERRSDEDLAAGETFSGFEVRR